LCGMEGLFEDEGNALAGNYRLGKGGAEEDYLATIKGATVENRVKLQSQINVLTLQVESLRTENAALKRDAVIQKAFISKIEKEGEDNEDRVHALERENIQLKALLRMKELEDEEEEAVVASASPEQCDASGILALLVALFTYVAKVCTLSDEESEQSCKMIMQSLEELSGSSSSAAASVLSELNRLNIPQQATHALDEIFSFIRDSHENHTELKARLQRGEKEFNDLAQKNLILVREYDRVAGYSKENEEIIDELSQENEQLKAKLKDLDNMITEFTHEMNQAEHVVKNHEEVNKRLNERNKYIANWLNKLHEERNRFQNDAAKTGKSNSVLSTRINEMRNQVNKQKEFIADLKKKIPRPGALMEVHSYEESLRKEREEYRETIEKDPAFAGQIGCEKCELCFIAMKYYQDMCEVQRCEVATIQNRFKKSADDCATGYKRKCYALEEEYKGKMFDVVQKEKKITAKNTKLNETIRELEERLETAKKADERRTQAKNDEIDALKKENRVLKKVQTDRNEDSQLVCATTLVTIVYRVFKKLDTASFSNERQNTVTAICSLVEIMQEAKFSTQITEDVRKSKCAECYDQIADLLLANHDDIVDMLLIGSSSVATAVQPEKGGDNVGLGVPYSMVDDQLWHDLSYVLKDALPYLVTLVDGISRGRWRAGIDFAYFETRRKTLDTAVQGILSGIASDELSKQDIATLRDVLFEKTNTGHTFIQWVCFHAAACMEINDHFARSMKNDMEKERANAKNMHTLNQNLVYGIEKQVRSLVETAAKSGTNSPLRCEDSRMLQTIKQCVDDADKTIGPFLADTRIPAEVKQVINNYQVSWKFLSTICFAIHDDTYKDRGRAAVAAGGNNGDNNRQSPQQYMEQRQSSTGSVKRVKSTSDI